MIYQKPYIYGGLATYPAQNLHFVASQTDLHGDVTKFYTMRYEEMMWDLQEVSLRRRNECFVFLLPFDVSLGLKYNG